MNRISYFATQSDREAANLTEEFIDDFPDAERRAAELGKTFDWVKPTRVVFADTDTFIAAYGRKVTHETRSLRRDRRGLFFCDCGAFLRGEAHMVHHRELAGWTSGVGLEG